MPRLILGLEPRTQAATVQASVQALPFVRDAVPARTANVVIVSVDDVDTAVRRRLANEPGVSEVFDDIQAIPQVVTEEVEDFLRRVRALRGEANAPLPIVTDPTIATDGGRPAIQPVLRRPEAPPESQGAIASIDDAVRVTGAAALHQRGIRGEGVIAAVVDTGADEDAIRADRQLDGIDLSGEGDPWSLLSPHGGMTTGIFAGDATTPGIERGVAPATDVFPIKTTLAASELIQAQDVLVRLADRTGQPVVANNCLTADAMVSTIDGPKPIVDVEVGDRVHACDVDVRGQQVCEVTDRFESGEKEVYDLQTRTRSVRASHNHPFLVADQDQQRLVWKALEDLTPGDLIAIRRENTAGAGKPHRFIEADGGQATLSGGQDVRLDGRTSSKGCKVPKETTRGFCQLLGALYGDGSVTYSTSNKNRVLFTTNLEKYPGMEWYVKAFERVFGVDWIERPKHGEQGAATAFVVNNKPLADFLHRIGLRVGKDRELPEWLYSIPQDQQLAFLRGYLDADGHVDKRGYIYVRSTHGDMVRQVWELFVSAGVKVTRVKEREVDIDCEPSDNYYEGHEVFGFTASSLADNRRIGSELAEYNKRLAPVREKSMDYDYVDKWTPEMDGFVFDRVVAIEAAGVEPTYDIEVAGGHNFVANGVLAHNSWGFPQCEGICEHPVTDAVASAAAHPRIYQSFAAGNQGGSAPGTCGAACDGSNVGISGPNSLAGVLSAGATGLNGIATRLMPYSSRGGGGVVSCGREKPDVVAPVFGTVPWGSGARDIGNGGGTSAAAPQVAGAVALLLGQRGAIANGAVAAAIQTTADQFQGIGFNGCTGWGSLRARRALEGVSVAAGLTGNKRIAAAGLTAGLLGAALRRRAAVT